MRALPLFLVLAVTPAWAVGPLLNDTGTDLCGNPYGLGTITCGSAVKQDADVGRDAQASAGTLIKIGGGAAGFDFTALDASGKRTDPTAGITPHPCVRDNVTGLVWEVKTADGGLRDRDWTYTWYQVFGTTPVGSPGTTTGCGTLPDAPATCDTAGYIAKINAIALCGFADWRMPTRQELESIVHQGTKNPAIDSQYFPNTSNTRGYAAYYWSGSIIPLPDSNPPVLPSDLKSAMTVNFAFGAHYVDKLTAANSVRLVRGP